MVGGRDTTGMTPGEIDRYVRAQMAAGADLYTLHARALADLEPDLILTQDLCRVCALPSGHVEEALDYLGCQADVLSLDPHSLAEVLDSILTVGRRAGVPDSATRLADDLRARLARVGEAVAGRRRPRVAVIEWVDPPFTAGHWVPDLVIAAGGEPVAARPGARSVQTSWAAIAAAAAELIVVAPCGYHLPDAIVQAQSVARALPGLPVWAIDADGIVVRPGPRLVDGVEAIASILHPDAVPAAPPRAVHRSRHPASPARAARCKDCRPTRMRPARGRCCDSFLPHDTPTRHMVLGFAVQSTYGGARGWFRGPSRDVEVRGNPVGVRDCRLRLPRAVASRYRGVPGAARQHRRGRPPHPQPQPGQLDPRRVHAPRGSRRDVVAVRPRRGAGTARPVGRRRSRPGCAGGWRVRASGSLRDAETKDLIATDEYLRLICN